MGEREGGTIFYVPGIGQEQIPGTWYMVHGAPGIFLFRAVEGGRYIGVPV